MSFRAPSNQQFKSKTSEYIVNYAEAHHLSYVESQHLKHNFRPILAKMIEDNFKIDSPKDLAWRGDGNFVAYDENSKLTPIAIELVEKFAIEKISDHLKILREKGSKAALYENADMGFPAQFER